MAANTYAYVVVTGDASDEEDDCVPGVYEVAIRESAPSDLTEEIALEAFHDTIAIGTLDDFTICVVDETGNPYRDQREGDDIRGEVDLLQYSDGAGEVGDPEFEAGTVGSALMAELTGAAPVPA
jgi:hypothetical protein